MGSICKQDNQMIRRGNIYIQKNCYIYPNFGVTKSDIIATGYANFFGSDSFAPSRTYRYWFLVRYTGVKLLIKLLI